MDYIYNEAERLTNEYDTRDPFELCKRLGINVGYNNDFKYLKGFYWYLDGFPYVELNGNMDKRDARLVLAHELGHDRLHRDIAQIAPMQDFMLFDLCKTEHEANAFAANLLISDKELLSLAEEEQYFESVCGILALHPHIVLFKINDMNQRGHLLRLPDIPDSDFLLH